MKRLRLSILTALLGSTAALAAPLPEKMIGSYQALLFSGSGDLGSPSGLVALTVSSKGAVSGKLTNEDNKTYSFKTILDYIASGEPAEGEPIGTATSTPAKVTISRGKLTPLTVELKIEDFGAEEEPVLIVDVQDEGASTGLTENGFKVKTYAKGETVPTLGAYTMAFELAEEPGEDDPAGSGYAIGKVDAKGILKVTGKTGDGTAFTASLPNGPANQFVMFVNPYKRTNSFLAGKIQLTTREDNLFHMLPAEDDYDFQWEKAGNAKDKSYRDGFGPLDVLVSVEPWVIPGKGETLADLLGLDLETEVFEINLGITVPSDRKPVMLVINSKNALEVKYNGSGLVTDTKSFAKIFSGKVDPKTGKITATLNLEDFIIFSPGKFKTVKRKVVIEGVLFNFADGFDSFASAFGLLPPLDPKTGTTTSGGIVFEDIQTDPFIIEAQESGIPGTYQGNFTRLVLSGTPPDDLPPAGTVSFIIHNDMKSATFNGITVPLQAYSPVDGRILFGNAKSSPKRNLEVIITFNPTTKAITKCDVQYIQYVGGRVMPVLSGYVNSVNNSIFKLD